jgi:hypothetical protein
VPAKASVRRSGPGEVPIWAVASICYPGDDLTHQLFDSFSPRGTVDVGKARAPGLAIAAPAGTAAWCVFAPTRIAGSARARSSARSWPTPDGLQAAERLGAHQPRYGNHERLAVRGRVCRVGRSTSTEAVLSLRHRGLPIGVQPDVRLSDRPSEGRLWLCRWRSEVGEYGEHAPVVVRRGSYFEFGEDAADVSLDGLGAEPEGVADALV